MKRKLDNKQHGKDLFNYRYIYIYICIDAFLISWANTMNFDILETFINEAPKCAMCGEQAAKRCSRCQREWYCRR